MDHRRRSSPDLRVVTTMANKRVTYFVDEEISKFSFGKGHPLKTERLAMTHGLTRAYNLWDKMEVCKPLLATEIDLLRYHSQDYVDFLKVVNCANAGEYDNELKKHNIDQPGEGCPLFDDLYRFCRLYCSGTIDGARKLGAGDTDIAINWAGGAHHAKKSSASGFCYVNDIVIAIYELLKQFQRVLYIDIDVHHGDGVQEAFYESSRVMTVSFHKYDGKFFPASGAIDDIGRSEGRGYSINCPLEDGIDDEAYAHIFTSVVSRVHHIFNPDAIVLLCGADSLADDKLGTFDLTIKGHGSCVSFVKSFELPLLVLGGGGYNSRNVAACWAYETALLLDIEVDEKVPLNEYGSVFKPGDNLHFQKRVRSKDNSDLEILKSTIFQNLKSIAPVLSTA